MYVRTYVHDNAYARVYTAAQKFEAAAGSAIPFMQTARHRAQLLKQCFFFKSYPLRRGNLRDANSFCR